MNVSGTAIGRQLRKGGFQLVSGTTFRAGLRIMGTGRNQTRVPSIYVMAETGSAHGDIELSSAAAAHLETLGYTIQRANNYGFHVTRDEGK